MDQLINSPSSSFLRLQLREAPSHVRLREVPSRVLRLDLCARSALMISEGGTSRRSRSSPLRLPNHNSLPNHEGAMSCEIGAGGCKSWIGLSMLRRNVRSFVSGAEDSGILAKQEDDGKEVKYNCDEIEYVVHKKDYDIQISIKIRLKHPISPEESAQLCSDVLKQMEKIECKPKEDEKAADVSTAFNIAGSMDVCIITIWKTSPERVKFLTNFFALRKTAESLRTIMYSQLQKFNPIKKLISKWEKIDLGEKTDGVWRLIQLKTADKPLVKDEEQKDAE